jgi:hypothetical protein
LLTRPKPVCKATVKPGLGLVQLCTDYLDKGWLEGGKGRKEKQASVRCRSVAWQLLLVDGWSMSSRQGLKCWLNAGWTTMVGPLALGLVVRRLGCMRLLRRVRTNLV